MKSELVFVVRLEPVRSNVTPYASLRRVLKYALRACGLKCVSVAGQQLTVADDIGKIDPAAARCMGSASQAEA